MASEVDGMVRVMIRHDGRKTKVSLDGLLFGWLTERYGGVLGAQAWIRRAAHRVEVLLEAGDPAVAIGRSGFSRLVQRMVVLDLMDAAGGVAEGSGLDGDLRGQAAVVEALKGMDGDVGLEGVGVPVVLSEGV